MSIWGDSLYWMDLEVLPPKVHTITNAGITDIGYNRVRFYDTPGTTLLYTEYVQNGQDCRYGVTDSLLISSDTLSILTENKGEDYISGTNTWGSVNLNGSGYSKSDDRVAFTSSSYGTFDLSNSNKSITAYTIVQQYGTTSGDHGLLAVGYDNSSGNSPAFFSRDGNIYTSLWGTDVNTGIRATDQHLLVIKIDSTNKKVYFYIDGVSFGNYVFNNSGAQVQITSYLNGTIQCDAYVSYFAVVNGAEDDYCILSNSDYIKSYYLDNLKDYEWALTANTGIAVNNITKNVRNSMDLYLARWTVKYYNKAGTSITFTEYVIDGEDATYGVGKDWAIEVGGESVPNILENISDNLNVYSISDYLLYIRTNYSDFSITINDWIYDLGDSWELTFKQNQSPGASGDWPSIIGTSISNSAKLYVQYNLWGGRNVMNLAYNGSWAGDGTASYNSPFDYDNFYKLVCTAGSFTLYKGSDLNSITSVAFSFSFSSASGDTNMPVVLFPLNNNFRLDHNFYRLTVYRNGIKIHDYFPSMDGITDDITGDIYTVSTTGHINGPSA